MSEHQEDGIGSLMKCMECPDKCVSCNPTETTCDCGSSPHYSPPCKSCLDDPTKYCSVCDIQDHSSCTACSLGYGYIASNQTCELMVCSDPHCLLCISGECAQCNLGYLLDIPSRQCLKCSEQLGIDYCLQCSSTECTRCHTHKLLAIIDSQATCQNCPDNCQCDGSTRAECQQTTQKEEEEEEEEEALEDKTTNMIIKEENEIKEEDEKTKKKDIQERIIVLIFMGLIIVGLIIFIIIIIVVRCKRKRAKINDKSWIVSEKLNVMMGIKELNESEGELMASCPICLENIYQPKLGVLRCGHSGFHTTCLEQWIKLHHTCPLCRANIPT